MRSDYIWRFDESLELMCYAEEGKFGFMLNLIKFLCILLSYILMYL